MKRENKYNRILDIFYRAFKGEEFTAKQLSLKYNMSTKSIKRDISFIRNFLAENREQVGNAELVYNRRKKAYSLVFDHFLLSKELMSIVKVLIGTRAFSKNELEEIIRKLKGMTSYEDRGKMNDLISNEMYHYKEVVHHSKSVIDNIWQLVHIIENKHEMTISYFKQSGEEVERRIRPLSIVFSEYYFYLIAYDIHHDDVPHHYRVDRIVDMVEHRKSFNASFDEGELKSKIQYMYPGVSRHIKFSFCGDSVQAILDKIPTARIVEKKGKSYIIEADVYGKGVNMFLLSQGSWVKVLEPQEYVEEMREEIKKMMAQYE